MPHRLKIYLVLTIVAAIALAVGAFLFVDQQAEDAVRRDVERKTERLEKMPVSLWDALNDGDVTGAVARVVLRGWRGGEGVREPTGVFVWSLKKRLEWASEGVSATNRVLISKMSHLKDWAGESKKKIQRGWTEMAASNILWARVDSVLYGVVFDGPVFNPVNPRVDVWLKGGWLVVFSLGVLLLCGFLMFCAAQKARRDDQMKTDFLSNCSHELKTPLAGIGLWAELLREGRLTTEEKCQRAYTIISDENARMTRLVENLLDFSRLEQGRRIYHPKSVNLGTLAADMVDLVRGDFRAHGIEARIEEDCVAWADVDAVKQILVNLLGNAAKYAATGGLVEVEVKREADGVFISVLDRGPGLSAKARARVFERFYRVDDELTSATGGLGLGLSISHALAQDMGGSLSVAARSGGGCVFTLRLPNGKSEEKA